MKRISSILCILMFILNVVSAHNKNQITGIVKDVKGQPIPFVYVQIKNTSVGTVTKDDGRFTLNYSLKACELSFSYIGYKTVVYSYRQGTSPIQITLSEIGKNIAEVVVKGNRKVKKVRTSAMTSIGSSQLKYKSSESLASALKEISGVNMLSSGSNVQLPVVHGLYGNRVLIINNGVRHAFQNWGSDHAPEIDVSSLNNIDIIKGASAVEYGSDAVGGVILVNSDPMNLDQAFEGQANLGYETNGRGLNSSIKIGQGFNKFAYYLSGSYIKTGDRHAPHYELSNTGKQEQAFGGGVHYHLANWNFKLRYSYINQNLGIPRASIYTTMVDLDRAINSNRPLFENDFSYNIAQPNQETQHHLLIGDIDWLSPIGKFTLKLSQQINKRKEFDVRRNMEAPSTNLKLNTRDIKLNWAHKQWGRLNGNWGIASFSQDNTNIAGTNNSVFIPNYNQTRLSAYIIESYHFNKNTFEAGIRLDQESSSVAGLDYKQDEYNDSFDKLGNSITLGYQREINLFSLFRTNIGTSTRFPNMAELYSYGLHDFYNVYGLWRYQQTGTNSISASEVLNSSEKKIKPERGLKWVSEYHYSKGKSDLFVTAYVNYISNFIYQRPLGVIINMKGATPLFIISQTDALFAGADIDYTYRMTKQLSGTLRASLLWSKNTSKDEPLINQPPHRLSYTLSYQKEKYLLFDKLEFKITPNYTFKQNNAPRVLSPLEVSNMANNQVAFDSEIFDFKEAPKGYFLLNAQLNWTRKALSGQIAVDNILNTSYRDYLNQSRYFIDEIGTNIKISLNYNF